MGFDEHFRCTFNGMNGKCNAFKAIDTVTCQCATHSNESKAVNELEATATPAIVNERKMRRENIYLFIGSQSIY